ncbi:MAG: hypothetical protein AAGC55_12105 [Myxococcota bacterium]
MQHLEIKNKRANRQTLRGSRAHSHLAATIASTLILLAACADDAGTDGADGADGADDNASDDNAPLFVDLPGDDLFPEGIIAAPNGDLYVTGFGNGAIVRIGFARDDDGANDGNDGNDELAVERVELFRAPGEDGLSSAVGMAIDEQRNRLWVANFSFGTFTSNMKVFDLGDGSLIATVEPARDGPESQFFNEVTIADDGRVYISDTLTPTIWTVGPDLQLAEVLVSDPLLANPDPERPFGLNGIALSPDGAYLIASVMDRIDPGDGRLVRIDLATQQVSDIALSGATAVFGGSDGMLFTEDGELLMVNVTPPAALVTAQFSADFSSALLVARDRFDAILNRPTAPAIRGERVFVVNSQLDHLIDDENGAVDTPPEIPFQIVGVAVDELLDD